MKREIKFRGWSMPDNKWVYGYLLNSNYNAFIVYDAYEDDYKYAFDNVFIPVDGKSFGEFTGLKDKNGVEIYEGDILLKTGNPEITKKAWLNQMFIVDFDKSYACFRCKPLVEMEGNSVFMPHIYECEVIGNIYQNPELLTL